MKKIFSIATIVIIAMTFLPSCKKCGHCVLQVGEGGSNCGKDYDDAKEACAQAGGTWVDE